MTTDAVPPRLPGTLGLRLEMLSDWHVGLGAGRAGGVDRLVRRDPDGLPFVPAKTLVGMWRDACETVAAGLDADWYASGGPTGPTWGTWLTWVFGSEPNRADAGVYVGHAPRPAHLDDVTPLRLEAPLRLAIGTRPRLAQATTFVKPGVRVDHASGVALDKHLRFEEVARVGAELVGTARLSSVEADVPAPAALLLVAGARLLERLGGNRRRGSGRCRLTIDGVDTDAWLDWLATKPPLPAPPPEPDLGEGADLVAAGEAAASSRGWEAVELRITLRQPVLVHSAVKGNVVEGLDRVPGAHLLALVSSRVPGIGRLVAGGDLLVGDAVPQIGDVAGRPAPAHVTYAKGGVGLDATESGAPPVVWNVLEEPPPADVGIEVQTKSHKDGYIGRAGAGQLPYRDALRREMTTHSTVDEEKQRPTEAVGGVYTYQTIPAGSVLRAQVQARAGVLPEGWWAALGGPARLGRSAKDEYGAVDVDVLGGPEELTPQTVALRGRRFVVWALSDLLLVDDWLRPDPTPDGLARYLSRAVGAAVTVPPEQGDERHRLAAAARHESWHRRWGLPRPSLVALRAGSVVRFEVDQGAELAAVGRALAQLVLDGVGERRAEGFGRIAVEDPMVSQPFAGLTVLPKPTPGRGGVGPEVPADAHRWARVVERAAWRTAIVEASTAKALSDVPDEHFHLQRSRPGASQLGALRAAVAGLDAGAGRAQATTWLDHLEGTPNRRRLWPPRSLTAIRQLLEQDDVVWTRLGLAGGPAEVGPDIVCTPDGAEVLRAELWAEAVRALLGAVLHELQDASGDTA